MECFFFSVPNVEMIFLHGLFCYEFFIRRYKYSHSHIENWLSLFMLRMNLVTIVLPLPNPDDPRQHEACCPLCKIHFPIQFIFQHALDGFSIVFHLKTSEAW